MLASACVHPGIVWKMLYSENRINGTVIWAKRNVFLSYHSIHGLYQNVVLSATFQDQTKIQLNGKYLIC